MAETLTDKRARQAVSLFSREVEKEYGLHFPHVSAPEEFWAKMGMIEITLTNALKRRPMSPAEMSILHSKAFQALRNTMIRLAKTVKQPRMHTIGHIDLETGKVEIRKEAYHD